MPLKWLVCPTTRREVEEELSQAWASDSWLAQWRDLLAHAGPDDELWTYSGDELDEYREGIALVRDGEVVDAISTHWLC